MITTARPAQAAPAQDRAGGMADPLQRHALRDPLAAPVQRKNLAQAALVNGVTANGTAAPVGIPGVSAVNVYETNLAKTTTRLEALQAASKNQAVVGGVTEGKQFTGDKDDFNKVDVGTLDPFIYRTKTKYGDESTTTNLTLDYQNSHRFTGYVIRVNDGASGQSSTMIDDNPLSPTATKGVPTNYSNIHADTGTNALSGLTGLDTNKTKDVNEEHIDAMTKIAGEGARWVAVRNHAAKLTDKSKFFTRKKTGDCDIKFVDFRTLWLSWKSAFGKEYGITDATFKSKLTSGADFKGDGLYNGYLANRTAADYDLDNSKSHTV